MYDLNSLIPSYALLRDEVLRQKVSLLQDEEFIIFVRFVETQHLVRLNTEIYYRFGELFKSPKYKEFFKGLAEKHHNGA